MLRREEVTDTAMSDFYRAFEDRFRGSREDIKERLSFYVPFVLPLSQIYPEGHILDLGCGRGEWLEVLRDNHMVAFGVDLDEGMLKLCNENNLTAKIGDLLEVLEEQEDESCIAISAFHVVEHLPFEKIHHLIREAKRVLKPGGLLILETPNPENVVVGTANFYIDPTHIRPIPALLLSFMCQYYNFPEVKVVRLHEGPIAEDNVTLSNVFYSVSPDFAVLAQKSSNSIPYLLAEHLPFYQGRDLDQTLMQYDRHLAIKFEQMSHQHTKLTHTLDNISASIQQVLANNVQLQKALSIVLNSRSWKITHPLRWCSSQLKLCYQYGPATRFRALIRKLTIRSFFHQ